QLIADALHCQPERAAPLAQMMLDKTGGNPFFVRQFLFSLAEEGMLTFDHDAACWSWDLERIHAKGYTDNVVHLMVGKLARLPPETREALQQFACLGNIADTTMLSLVLETPEEQVPEALWPAVAHELLERLAGAYRFVHDRVQEAAYSLIPEERRGELHLRIGRLLAANTAPELIDDYVFDIVSQLNRGAALITSAEERAQLAKFNLLAGRRAKASTAYAAALNYFVAGTTLLPEDAWERQHQLAFALELNRAECEFLIGALADAEERLVLLSNDAVGSEDQAAVACLRIDLYTALGQTSRSVAVGLDYLRQHLGIDWSPHPGDEDARREYARIWLQVGSRTIEELIDLPLMSDPASLAALDVLTKLVSAVWHTDANLACMAICGAVNLSLERGNSDGSCYHYVSLGHVAGPRFGDYAAGFRFGRLGYQLVEHRQLKRFQARTYKDFAAHVLPWTRHVRAGRDILRRALEIANQSGDLTFAGYSYVSLNSNLLAAGDPLMEVQRQVETGLAFAQKVRFQFVIDLASAQLGLVRTLRGLTRKFGSFDDCGFDELEIERRFLHNPDLILAETCYFVRKLQARFFAGDYEAAVDASLRAQRLPWISVAPFEETAEHHFYGALARAACCDSAVADQRARHTEALAAHHRQLQVYAENCPQNFENRAALVGAEIARIEGRPLEAMDLFEQAIRSARDNSFVQNEALAYELAGRFYSARGFEEIARMYLRNARHGYLRWGADGKVRQLDEMYSYLRKEPVAVPTGVVGTLLEQLDLAMVIKVSQAISGEIVLEKLIDTLMRTAMQQAGAERAVLVLAWGPVQRIAAEATTSGDAVSVHLREEAISEAVLPLAVLQYVLRTRESVILDDAATQSPFAADPYIRDHHTRSVLCLPLLNQTKLIGVLYLENNLAPRVFAPGRTAVLKLIASQAAISLENTRLYRDLAEREAKIRRLVDANIIGIIIWDFEGRIIEANDAFLHMVGYDRDDIVSGRLRWTDLTPAEWLDRDVQQFVPKLKMTGSLQPFEKEYFRKDGSRVPVLIGVATLQESGDQGVAFVLDLTERKRAEAAVRRSEEELREVIETVPAMVWTALPDGNVDFMSQRWQEFTGLSPEESLGRDWGAAVHPEDREQHEGRWRASLDTGHSFEAEMRLRSAAGGDYRWFSDRAVPLRDEDGNILKWYGFVVDIEDRKRAEEALHKAQAELAHVARVATMGALTSSIAHELHQPLGAIVTNANAALRWLAGQPPDIDEVRETLGRIVRDGHRAGEVIGGMRALIKKTAAVTARVDLNGLIEDAVALVQSELRRHRILLRTELADDLPPVAGDRVQLQQVILNLMMNGIEAMNEVADRPRELLITSRREASGAVLVAVHDTGTGFDPQSAEQVFAPFYSTKAEGLGMGLAICQSIIEAHGGRLWASAHEPSGAVFQFTLPSTQNEIAPAEHAG
ncbi:PAS domain S-box protein, partial [Rhizobium mongolense]|uniref:PAS domain S-box protein n=2 Tax=Rhizobium mongolense TaxID=57676 RepID=UPI003558920D